MLHPLTQVRGTQDSCSAASTNITRRNANRPKMPQCADTSPFVLPLTLSEHSYVTPQRTAPYFCTCDRSVPTRHKHGINSQPRCKSYNAPSTDNVDAAGPFGGTPRWPTQPYCDLPICKYVDSGADGHQLAFARYMCTTQQQTGAVLQSRSLQ